MKLYNHRNRYYYIKLPSVDSAIVELMTTCVFGGKRIDIIKNKNKIVFFKDRLYLKQQYNTTEVLLTEVAGVCYFASRSNDLCNLVKDTIDHINNVIRINLRPNNNRDFFEFVSKDDLAMLTSTIRAPLEFCSLNDVKNFAVIRAKTPWITYIVGDTESVAALTSIANSFIY